MENKMRRIVGFALFLKFLAVAGTAFAATALRNTEFVQFSETAMS